MQALPLKRNTGITDYEMGSIAAQDCGALNPS